jgi:hypothetical protein
VRKDFFTQGIHRRRSKSIKAGVESLRAVDHLLPAAFIESARLGISLGSSGLTPYAPRHVHHHADPGVTMRSFRLSQF